MIILKFTIFVYLICILIDLSMMYSIWTLRISKFTSFLNRIKLKLLSSVMLFVFFVTVIVIVLITLYLLLVIAMIYPIIDMIFLKSLYVIAGLAILYVIMIIVCMVKANCKISLHLLVIDRFFLASRSP